MTMRMLIDARHREETRVAVVKGSRIEEFDFESAERKQLKGNIYLAKVTRVEPSLQAAFVDYGGNRHGFLAFSEIHPDYYQIPKEDRDALLREEAEHAAEEAALRAQDDADEDDHEGEDGVEVLERPHDDEEHEDEGEAAEGEEASEGGRGRGRRRGRGGKEDEAEALRQRRMNLRRRYKIQDVIRRRQVLLVQVVKEERGNKGAALTTYLSLAGRYCVLMPNTAHGGGISRKISSAADRKRLKTIMADLKLPPTMGCIVRTAGLQRTKTEIKRDFDYLARLWDGIRETTLQSSAPALVYGDSDLLKRAIRDIYNKDIDEVIVEGEEGYRQAKEFMRLLMPSHARKVKQYADAVPLFQRAGVEEQLSAMYHPVVQLKSGGYLVINPTEALVSIDINSGRSTREHSIEQTATQTNLEAAQEIARQLRLRDMAGLVVIDFIDMDHGSNVRKVEKAMKEALKNDRARIQVGRISAFGLMEMSRQRLRTGVLEASTRQCPHCEGTGLVRTASSAGLSALRLIEDEAARGRGSQLVLRASQEAAFYVLNRKRSELAEIEDRYGVTIEIASDGELEGARMSVEAGGPPPAHAPRIERLIDVPEDEDYIEEVDEEEDEEEEAAEAPRARQPREARERDEGEGEGRGKRRRRRRGRGRRGREHEAGEGGEAEHGEAEHGDEGEEPEAVEVEAEAPEHADRDGEGGEGEGGRKRRRRGRRGGRRGAGQADEAGAEATGEDAEPAADVTAPAEAEAAPEAAEAPAKPKRSRRKKADAEAPVAVTAEAAPEALVVEAEAAEAPAKPKRARRKKADAEAAPVEAAPEAVAEVVDEVPAEKPKRTRRKAAAQAAPTPADASVEAPAEAEAVAQDLAPEDSQDPGAPRRGWWQRTFGA
ncbi:MAG: ribonuclease E/G [Sphingomonas sp.]|uniref:Rne/Rng family ribonuclease n=1 Tax=Sphingomonas sp. TaxID=28214 RepID=UPI0022731DB5|nr:ribonuclease E/G [Sphingomonas sp.]MCX8476374.1 ribonuclease E/G [Sphingomonas sp.]